MGGPVTRIEIVLLLILVGVILLLFGVNWG
jgi:hypothetical protein